MEKGQADAIVEDDENDEDRPARKRRKLSVARPKHYVAKNNRVSSMPPARELIPLARVAIDFHFTGSVGDSCPEVAAIDADVSFVGADETLVIAYGIGEDHGTTHMRFALPTAKGAILKIAFDGLPPDVIGDLRLIALPGRQKQTCDGTATKDHPATITRCILKHARGKTHNVVRLEASLFWRDGVAAFPAGLPTGKERTVYADYDIKERFQPDESRTEVEHNQSWTPQDFYESVHVPDARETPAFATNMETELYPFQRRALGWMLHREGMQSRNESLVRLSKGEIDIDQVKFYDEVPDADGAVCYVNHLQGKITRHRPDELTAGISGGLLAEEMGLGKTVEMIALILANRSSTDTTGYVLDEDTGAQVWPSKATLIVTPPSILPQWHLEMARHAPSLRVMHYTGVPKVTKRGVSDDDVLKDLTQNYDVVLTTYQVLTREVHFAEDPPDRGMRNARRFERTRSPLVRVRFWRAVMDEAQMLESSVTAAARVACKIPRVHSWAVSGTPLRKDVADLHGLLVFLRVRLLANNTRLWSHLITNHRHTFKRLFGTISLRHTKAQIRDELRLPPQKRVVITMPFTAIEQQHYRTLVDEMRQDLHVEANGSPVLGDWDPNHPSNVEVMRAWLLRLRQTCLHPQVGGHNRRAVGRGQAPLRTVTQVLEVMIEQNESSTRTEEHAALASQLLRAHIIGNNAEDKHRSEKSLVVYEDAAKKSATLVTEARKRLDEAAKLTTSMMDDNSSSEPAPLYGRVRNHLRTALELNHVCAFFTATACYQIKADESLTAPGSERFAQLEQREAQLYEDAKILRREILADTARKSEDLMSKMRSLDKEKRPTKMPKIKDLTSLGGIESRRVVEKSDDLYDTIRGLSAVILSWRLKMAEYLLEPLVDNEGVETTGDEYEDSTKQQDELYVYFDALRACAADLNTFVTGEDAPLIDHEAKQLVRSAKRHLDPDDHDKLKEQCHAPETLLKLFAIRTKYRSRKDEVGSVRGLIQEARALEGAMQWQNGSARAQSEANIVQQHIACLQSVYTAYTRALAGLEKEIDLFRSTQNSRLDFYRQLQDLSDAVAPYKEDQDQELDVQAFEAVTAKELQQNNTLALLKTKYRFLLHLRDESDDHSTSRICVICQSTFENGVLTVCGHQYCKECIQHWWQQHRSCPVCKRRLALVDFHDITYKPQELRAQEEEQGSIPSQNGTEREPGISSLAKTMSIYSEVDSKILSEIKSIDLPNSYGTKIDTLTRHLLWIREHDPGAKSIVFSQYRQFLDVLTSAFKECKVGYSRLGQLNAVERFRQDPSVDCMLLDAKTDSSGLTLVNATHVFICEPLIQTAVELQAIARVHRIGQTRQTTVWMYLISDTVEESIYSLSVTRRMAHVQSRQELARRAEKSRSTTPAPLGEQAIEMADTEELQSASLGKLLAGGKYGGELVGNGDLWGCLFGKVRPPAGETETGLRKDFEREVRGFAAERRRANGLTVV
ncbi:hypothetical protein B0A48_05770 [Cryoendolithus antarcticus]|uniref:RING-type domain-containing protein n=1 Tax=Cryoendolithus antarcticus TaxID=1507870 RepID=A0A1V8TBY4_9PEZI|nr:hypothetical protein B0A48_05770 [Cryoendolithus antarcticus]